LRYPRLPSVLHDEPLARLKGSRVADAVIKANFFTDFDKTLAYLRVDFPKSLGE